MMYFFPSPAIQSAFYYNIFHNRLHYLFQCFVLIAHPFLVANPISSMMMPILEQHYQLFHLILVFLLLNFNETCYSKF